MSRVFDSSAKISHTCMLLAATAAALLSLLLVSQTAWTIPEEEIDQGPGGASYVAGELLVVYKTDINGAAAEKLPEASAGKVEEELPELDTQVIEFPKVKDEPTEQQREQLLSRKRTELAQEPEVESVSLNYVYKGTFTPNDPRFDNQYGLAKIRAPRAWNKTLGENIDIAVVDTGIDTLHPDLKSKIADQRNFVSEPETNSARDDNGHGTSVSGVAAATTNNGTGVAGACPNCRLLVAKSLDANNEGTADDVADGIVWSANNGAEIVNLSLGAIGADAPVLKRAVNYAARRGIVVVAAAGNQGVNRPSYPAAYKNAISVAATDRNDRRASFSNYGRTIDVAAPGVSILTTDRRSRAGFSRGNYTVIDGTSFSSPFTAGVAGLLAAQGRSDSGIRDRIERSAKDLGPNGRDNLYGHGRIDAAAAVGASTRTPTPSKSPEVSNPQPTPGSTIKVRKPTIRATIRDSETDLRKKNLTLILDGKKKSAFKYDTKRNRLSYKPDRNLSSGSHSVKVIARDGQGKMDTRSWRFKVKKRSSGDGGPLSLIDQPGFPFNILPEDPIFDQVREESRQRRK